jgi:sigma-B regulation protein RsbU (phosphoserine phosphatase)
MILVFSLGVLVGAGAGWFFWWTSRREINRLDEQRQMLAEEKLIVFDFVHNMVEAIGEGVTREELFERVVHAAILSTGALSACIFEQEDSLIRGVAVEGLFPPHRPIPESARSKITTRAKFIEQILKTEVFKVGEGLVGAVAQSGIGILIENALEDPRIVKHEDPSLEVRSVIVVPISFRERKLGVLAIVNPSDGGAFGDNDFSLAQNIAEQAGLAIHNLDLMASQIEKNKLDVDLGLAHEIQSMLLPRDFPTQQGLDVASHYRSAQKVGGDLFDVFEIDADRVGVAIADVSGKGIPASLLMAICQSNLRHFASDLVSPAKVLSALNEVLHVEMRPDMFITVTYAVIDVRKGELLLARGGHELPLLLQNDPSGLHVEFIHSEGMALGMVPSAIFDAAIEEKQLPFGPGSLLLLYTDGLTEAIDPDGKEFGNEQLAAAASQQWPESSQALIGKITHAVETFCGKPDAQIDDVTLVAIGNR